MLATGFDEYDPSEKLFWGYGKLDGVHTLAEVENFVKEDNLEALLMLLQTD